MDRESRLIVLDAMEGKAAEQVPIAPPFQAYWALALSGVSVQESIEDPHKAAEVQINIAKECGFDALESSWDWLMPVEALGCRVRIPVNGEIVTKTRLICGPESLSKMSVPDPKKDYRAVSAVSAANEIASSIGDERFLYVTFCSPFTLVGELRGVEALLFDMIMQPDFARDMLEFGVDTVSEYCHFMAESGAEGLLMCDPTASGSLVNAKEFHDFSRPYMNECLKKVRKHSMHPMAHICGDTSELLEDISEMEIDAYSLDNQVSLKRATRLLSGKAVFGNLRPLESLYLKEPSEIIEESIKCIRKAGPSGFVLASGGNLTIGTPVSHIRAMKEASKFCTLGEVANYRESTYMLEWGK